MFKPSLFEHKKIGVLGIGRSGRAVAKLLADKGFDVLVSEESSPAVIPQLPTQIEVETGGHSEKLFACACLIKSPGIFPKHPALLKAKALKIPVFSELEVALAFLPKKVTVFAVTGTNGKTTTTTLLGEILKENARRENKGHNVFVCGNIGTPVSECVGSIKSGDDLVIEVSSYQLEDSTYFRPHIACLLNITPDHLDHHGGMKNYIKAKAKVFKNQRANDFLILNGADGISAQFAPSVKSQVLAFSTQPKHLLRTDVFFDGDELVFRQGHHFRPPQLLKGIHNVENAMAAALMAFAKGVADDCIQSVFNRFRAMEHRIEQFAYHKGVTYVNDSKATNLDSTLTALKSFEPVKNIWLILGGRDKGASYEVLLPYLHKYCARVLSIGESMDKIEKELHGDFPITRCTTLDNAVKTAMQQAKNGDIVLLSPACSSFDQFKDFEQRGTIFKQLVNAHIFNERTQTDA